MPYKIQDQIQIDRKDLKEAIAIGEKILTDIDACLKKYEDEDPNKRTISKTSDSKRKTGGNHIKQ